VVDGEVCEAIGLFKSENKDTYIKVFNQQDAFEVSADNGVNINKLDKGCIVFNTEKDKGYKLVFIDNTNNTNGIAKPINYYFEYNSKNDLNIPLEDINVFLSLLN
jgi:hypothetical protein